MRRLSRQALVGERGERGRGEAAQESASVVGLVTAASFLTLTSGRARAEVRDHAEVTTALLHVDPRWIRCGSPTLVEVREQGRRGSGRCERE